MANYKSHKFLIAEEVRILSHAAIRGFGQRVSTKWWISVASKSDEFFLHFKLNVISIHLKVNLVFVCVNTYKYNIIY